VNVQRIIYATDFSEAAAAALPAALELARRFDAELDIVHVAERLLDVMPVTGGVEQDAQEEFDQPVRDHLERWIARRVPPDLNARAVLKEGDAADTILELARERDANLIVMGVHGRSAVERWLLGSVTEAVLRKAPCPVLAVPRPASP
jgi:nucleotide-binding universal stress UspA family protein